MEGTAAAHRRRNEYCTFSPRERQSQLREDSGSHFLVAGLGGCCGGRERD